jgi:two-component system response regulator ArlR
MDFERHEVRYNKELVELTKKEFDLLEILIRNKGVVLSREKILNEVWGYDFMGDTNVVDVYIRYIRSKVDDRFNVKLIHTVRGVGYVFKDEIE